MAKRFEALQEMLRVDSDDGHPYQPAFASALDGLFGADGGGLAASLWSQYKAAWARPLLLSRGWRGVRRSSIASSLACSRQQASQIVQQRPMT